MNKLIFYVCAAAAFAGLTLYSCNKAKPKGGETPPVKIGIAKIVQHPALDTIEQGIQDGLGARNITAVYDLQNANGDMSTAAQIAAKFKTEKVDIAVGIATPTSQALANTIKDIPVVFTTVTDPIGAGLVTTVAHGEGNVTGLSDAIPTVEHITLFKKIAGINTLGYIYTASEANSAAALKLVEEGCLENGITLIAQSINSSADVRQAAQSVVNRVDGLYLTTDNTVFSGLQAIIEVFRAAKKPLFSGDVTGVLNGGCMIASGFNYYKAGIATADIIVEIINGKNPDTIPVKFLAGPDETDFLIDLDSAKNCGIEIPEQYIEQANKIFENGTLYEK
ncbi:MAG: ABC transporter substrate-binding protein [Spirochaetaceae bacterium]|jgi:putative ABC transport system substrate-binding protein|nr:ABC transporter substrate-binding protein [Spirochaetaceae bacterium]